MSRSSQRVLPLTPVGSHLPQLVADKVASRLFAQDKTLWGPQAEDESGKRHS